MEGGHSIALVVSSMSFAVPAAVAGGTWTSASMSLLLVTSLLQHASFVGEHPKLKWIDRAVATALGLGYTSAAVASGRAFAASCGVASAALFVQSKRRCMGRRMRIAAHVAVHVLGALGVVAFGRGL